MTPVFPLFPCQDTAHHYYTKPSPAVLFLWMQVLDRPCSEEPPHYGGRTSARSPLLYTQRKSCPEVGREDQASRSPAPEAEEKNGGKYLAIIVHVPELQILVPLG